MNILITTASRTGNTARVARGIADAFEARGAHVDTIDCLAASPDAHAVTLDSADMVCAGFGTYKGDCAPEMAALLEGLSGRRVFLFGTAGFGGSPDYFDRILGNVRAHLPEDATYMGGVMCQGKMGPQVRKRYEAMLAENPGDERTQAMIENFDAAATHPDEADIEAVAAAALAAAGLDVTA